MLTMSIMVGAGIGGLSCALGLRQNGHRVKVQGPQSIE